MFLPIIALAVFIAIALVAAIAYLTREHASHDVRHEVRHAVVTHHPKDTHRGIRH
jgi:hypothetical protein